MFTDSLAWILLIVLAMVSGILGAALLLHWHSRRNLVNSTRYLLDRLKVVETDLEQVQNDVLVLSEYLRRKGYLDDEDLALLRRELIEIPKQVEAEKNELLKEAQDKTGDGRVVKNTSDTYH